MSLRANFQLNYLKRYLLLAGVLIPISLWFAYDGFIGYPKQQVYAEKYDALRELELEPVELKSQWEAIAKENGWPKAAPKKKAQEIADSITGQYVWGSLSFTAGFIALIYFLRSRGTWVESTETGLRTSWGQIVQFRDVVLLDKKKWENKGIARASYRDNGLTRAFIFDDFKFDREPLGFILRKLEAKLDRGQIVGGPAEPPIVEKSEVVEKSDTSAADTPVESSKSVDTP